MQSVPFHVSCLILACGVGLSKADSREALVEAGTFVKIYDPSVGEKGKWYINDPQ